MRKHRILLFGTTCLALAVAAACDGGDKGNPLCDLTDSHYLGSATDETCMVLLDEEERGNVQVGTANASVFVIPTNGYLFSSSAGSITFTWTSPIDVNGDTASVSPPRSRTLAARVGDALAPIRSARAHEPPVTGAVHMIRLKGAGHDGGDDLYFTTLLHLELTGHGLEHVKEAAQPVPVEITSVYLTENRILTPATDGPFRPAADTTFSFTP